MKDLSIYFKDTNNKVSNGSELGALITKLSSLYHQVTGKDLIIKEIQNGSKNIFPEIKEQKELSEFLNLFEPHKYEDKNYKKTTEDKKKDFLEFTSEHAIDIKILEDNNKDKPVKKYSKSRQKQLIKTYNSNIKKYEQKRLEKLYFREKDIIVTGKISAIENKQKYMIVDDVKIVISEELGQEISKFTIDMNVAIVCIAEYRLKTRKNLTGIHSIVIKDNKASLFLGDGKKVFNTYEKDGLKFVELENIAIADHISYYRAFKKYYESVYDRYLICYKNSDKLEEKAQKQYKDLKKILSNPQFQKAS